MMARATTTYATEFPMSRKSGTPNTTSAKAPTTDAPPALVSFLAADGSTIHAHGALAGWNSSRARRDVVAQLLLAGGASQDGVRASFMTGYVADRLNQTAERPTAELLTAAHAVLKTADKERTEAERKACQSARQGWKRALADAGVKTTEARGGARERTEKTAPAPTSDAKQNADALPKPTTKDEANKAVTTAFRTQRAYVEKHRATVHNELYMFVMDTNARLDAVIAKMAEIES